MGHAADPDRRLPQHVVERDTRAVDGAGAEQRSLGQAGAIAFLGRLVEGPRDQPGALQPERSRGLVGERGEQGVAAVREGVHRRGAQLRLGRIGHRDRVGQHQLGANPGNALVAGRQAVDGGDRGARERGRDRRHPASPHRRDRLGGVDHPPAAERDQSLGCDLVEDRCGCVGNLSRRDEMHPRGRGAQRPGARQRPLRREQVEVRPSEPLELLRRLFHQALPEDHHPARLGVDLAQVRHKPGAGLEPAAS